MATASSTLAVLERDISIEHTQLDPRIPPEPAKLVARRRWPSWIDWLRALFPWFVSPWRSMAALVNQIGELQTAMAGHVATLQRLQTALDYDGLTGAHSRLYFLAALRQEVARYARDEHVIAELDQDLARRARERGLGGKEFVVGILDIDRFKKLNDRKGHQAGDLALLHIVEESRPILRRDGDVFARYGGDEFAFLLPQTRIDDALALAETLRAAVASHGSVTVSIGLVAGPAHGSTAESLLEAADAALYRAKTTRNTVYVSGEV